MFILSIVPIHLSSARNAFTGAAHQNIEEIIKNPDPLSYIETRIQDLEALLTAELLQQYGDVDSVSGYDNDPSTSDKEAIKAELELLKKKDVELRKATGQDSNVDEKERLNQIAANSYAVDQRIKDLEDLKQSALTGIPLDRHISGIDNSNLNADELNKEIDGVKAYKAELNSLGDFWKTISDGHVGETQGSQNTKPPVNTNTKPPVNNTVDPGPPLPPVEVSHIDLNNLNDDQKFYLSQVKTGFKYVLDDAKKGKDINSKEYLTNSFAKKIFSYLKDLTGVKVSDFKKSEVLKYISKIADGSAEDLNGDGNFDVDDVVRTWENATPPPPPPPPKEAEKLVELTDSVKKLFSGEDSGMGPDELVNELTSELSKFTGSSGSLDDRTEALMTFLENGKTVDKNGDGEFTYEDLVEIWKSPNQISSTTDSIIKVLNGQSTGNTFALKKQLYALLSKETGKETNAERKKAVSDVLSKIASGDKTGDLNGDKALDYGDVIAAWNSVED